MEQLLLDAIQRGDYAMSSTPTAEEIAIIERYQETMREKDYLEGVIL